MIVNYSKATYNSFGRPARHPSFRLSLTEWSAFLAQECRNLEVQIFDAKKLINNQLAVDQTARVSSAWHGAPVGVAISVAEGSLG